jgi:hypothetical protein
MDRKDPVQVRLTEEKSQNPYVARNFEGERRAE